jgi:glycosyltransferase involved in cell wall biosynthesis
VQLRGVDDRGARQLLLDAEIAVQRRAAGEVAQAARRHQIAQRADADLLEAAERELELVAGDHREDHLEAIGQALPGAKLPRVQVRAAKDDYAVPAHGRAGRDSTSGRTVAYGRSPPSMHVGLNLIFLVPGETGGMETYARELILALRAERSDLKLTAFINREAAASDGPWGDLIPSVTIPVNARNRVEWVLGEQRYLPRAAALHGVDLVHSLASTSPAWGPFKRVTTIHDLIYKRYPEAHFGVRTLGMRMLVPLAARRSHRIVAISESTRRDLTSLLGTPPGKIDVVPEGTGTSARAVPVPAAELRRSHRLGERPVLLSASAKRPVKNLKRLIDALALIRPERRPVAVLPGYATPYEDELREHALAAGVGEDVRWLGWVGDAELEGLYALADLFVFPSLYEGFGLPVLEAMRRGVPVACSDRSSLPEIAGDAALLFDPEDPRAIAGAIEQILGDPAEAELMRAAGRAQAERFTWRATARGTLASYERTLRSA